MHKNPISTRRRRSALNDTQEQLLYAFIQYPMGDIMQACLDDMAVALKALSSIFSGVSAANRANFDHRSILPSILQLNAIVMHPCPQNRAVGYTAVQLHADPDMVPYKNEHGQVKFERRGLLGLTARHNGDDEPVTKEAVVRYIQDYVYDLQRRIRLTSAELKAYLREHHEKARDLMESCHLGFHAISNLSVVELDAMLQFPVDRLAVLFKQAHISLATFIACDQALRQDLVDHAVTVVRLMDEANVGITLDEFLSVRTPTRRLLLQHADSVIALLKSGEKSLAELRVLSEMRLLAVIAPVAQPVSTTQTSSHFFAKAAAEIDGLIEHFHQTMDIDIERQGRANVRQPT